MTPYYIDKRTISTDYRSDRAYNMNFWTSDVQEAVEIGETKYQFFH